MPTYAYRCASCQHQLEVKQQMSEAPLTECPECGRPTLRKQLNNSGVFILKGGGWYKDGYSSARERKAASEKGSTDSQAQSQETTSGEGTKQQSGSDSKTSQTQQTSSTSE